MKLTFSAVATFTAGLAFVLAVAWTFFPGLYLVPWDVPYSDPMGVTMRRAGALFFTFACIFFLVRNAPPSPARTALAQGTALGLIALALQVGYEYLMGHASAFVLFPLTVEVILAAAFFAVARAPK